MKLALVLGGGAARGLAHIGVLRVLEERGIKPDLVVGCSMGALVGAFYAIGTPARIMEGVVKRMAATGEFEKILRVRPSTHGFLDPEPFEEFLRAFFGDVRIEHLPVPFVAVATDLEAFSLAVIRRGNLAAAVRASTAIPGLFPPLERGKRLLVDGGVVEPLPVEVARRLGADAVVAVNVLRGDLGTEEVELAEGPGSKPGGFIKEMVRELATIRERNLFSVALRSVFLAQAQLIRRALQVSRPEVLISPEPKIGIMDFAKAKQAVEAGREAAKRALKSSKWPPSG